MDLNAKNNRKICYDCYRSYSLIKRGDVTVLDTINASLTLFSILVTVLDSPYFNLKAKLEKCLDALSTDSIQNFTLGHLLTNP